MLITPKYHLMVYNLHRDMTLGEVLGKELLEMWILLVGDNIYLIYPWSKAIDRGYAVEYLAETIEARITRHIVST